MSGWTPEELRRATIEGLDAHADVRVRDALAHGTLSMTPGVTRWESSHGPVEGHHVILALDAERLGALRAAPGIIDAICAAVSATIASRPGEALTDLVLRWEPQVHAEHGAYRDEPPGAGATSLVEALVGYLRGLGEEDLAVRVADVTVEQRGPSDVRLHLDAGAGEGAALVAAVRDLLGEPRARVVVHT
ncbi:MAG TPA: hypothetical protein VF765_20055 [Polyangiaceae bacterium]